MPPPGFQLYFELMRVALMDCRLSAESASHAPRRGAISGSGGDRVMSAVAPHVRRFVI
jgi:hypothetical protein